MGRSRSRSRSRSYSRSYYRHHRSRSQSESPEDNARVHIADLGIDCSEYELENAFKRFGPLVEVWVARNPPCFAFIVFRHAEDADQAIRDMDGQSVCGSRIRVTKARPRTRGIRTFGGRRNFDPNLRCFQCGEPGHFSRDCDEVWRSRRRVTRVVSRAVSRSRSRSYERRPRRDSRSRSRSYRRSRSGSSYSYSRSRSRSPSFPKSKMPNTARPRKYSSGSNGSGRSRNEQRRSIEKDQTV